MLEHAELSDFFAELESIQNVEKATQIELNLLKELKIELEEREAEEEKTKSGILLPETAEKEKPEQGKVLAVGPGKKDKTGKYIPL